MLRSSRFFFIDDAAPRQVFRGDLQRARRTLSLPVPLLLIARLRNGRQRDGGGVTLNKTAANRYHQYDTIKRREMHPCLENSRASSTSYFYTNKCYKCIRFCCEQLDARSFNIFEE